ncbi:hypothetical protein GLOIN_2v1884393 [Rhizophagus clarus]|uniref:Uncharacterized protein n=1 Tax=Rhizophagus clarus TaxID=94130 RepID=A0A8H3KX66_9GLOM|nr:hypothetical protein GLOIN_2v1884393 [Rhizophagus clarus]
MHDRTFGIKCCRTKGTTGLLELSVAGRKARPDFWNQVLPDEMHDRTFVIKCCQTKSTTRLLELSVAGRKA